MIWGEIVKVEDLSAQQIKVMYSIMMKYYVNITRNNFFNDLRQKAEVILLCDENDVIHGFTTLAIFRYDEHTQLLFSGDTIIEKKYWGKNDLMPSWLNNAMSHAEKFDGKTYWLLLTKGYKTYKFLHTFFHKFYPCVEDETPQKLQEVIDKFAIEQFGNRYQNGIYTAGKDFLKEEFDDADETKMKNKHTAFFLEKNPNYKIGDELVCLAELSLDNLNRLGLKILER